MAEMTEGERQAQFQHDIDIINRQADAKIAKMRADAEALIKRRFANTERFIRAVKTKFDVRKKTIQTKADEEIAKLDLQQDQEENALMETDIRGETEIRDRLDLDIQKVELWRRTESADEVRQLQTHTQRPRKD